ncbi:MAG: CoA transferase, partial [Terricaulis sp.]
MLEGLKIVEMATYIAAPGAGGIMADWGADVIKV